MLYPLCKWFAGVKQRRKDWWLVVFVSHGFPRITADVPEQAVLLMRVDLYQPMTLSVHETTCQISGLVICIQATRIW